jgi:hypothetical protein
MSQATQVPETIGGAIPRETVVEAMREDGFLPPKLPEWKNDVFPPARPPVVEPRVELTPQAHISFEAKESGSAFFMVYRGGYGDLQPFTGIEARKAEVLPRLLADIEAALPALRAMVRNLKETTV